MAMSRKRGQVVSADLIIAIAVFLFAFALFYNNVSNMQKADPIGFKATSEGLFGNMKLRMDNSKYLGDINFLEDNTYRINLAKLDNFNNLTYAEQKDIITSSVQMPTEIKDIEFCMFFENSSGDVKKSIGNSTILVGSSKSCGEDGFAAKPSCPEAKYTTGLTLTRPVIYGSGEIANMNVLLCGVQT
jgi:hypothetical protein